MSIDQKSSFFFSVVLSLLLLLSAHSFVFAADDLSGDDILVKVDRKSQVVTRGDILSILTLKTKKADGTTTNLKFGALARKTTEEPDKTLMYLLQPEFNKGSIFLTKDTPEGETRMWSYLPALQRKIEFTGSQKEGSFLGTTLSREEIASWSLSEEFTGKIVEETTVEIGDQSLPAYKLELTAKEGADPQYPQQTIWVGKGNWLLFRTKNYSAEGKLKAKMEVKELTTFEENTVTKKLIKELVEISESTTVIYEKRERPERDIPDSVFDPENLSEFDPEKWGMTD